ncbi:glycosyl hydrolase family 18 protein [Paenibacillus sp. EC2-1]|uniref:glycosyl hydrolase family 18 protein n=1 Tax=Paenibacillus sp. EC2-1 TaxID=3388665 RepID=UPI003BEEC2CA
MNLRIHNRYSKWMVIFLVFVLSFTPLLNAPVSYAAETDTPLVTDSETPPTNVAPETPPTEVTPETPTDVTPETPPTDEKSPTDETTAVPPAEGEKTPATELKDAAIAGEQDPLAPQNLRVKEIYHNRALLEWDFKSGPNGTEDPNDIQIWNLDTDRDITWGNRWTRYAINLTPETTYRVYITWNSDTAKVHKSNVVEFTTLKDTSEYKESPLTPPSNLKVSSVTEDSVTLNWGSSPNATGYDFYVNGAWKGGTWNNAATSFTYSDLEVGKKYTFMVGAQHPENPDNSKSKNSNKVTLTWGELSTPEALQVITATRTAVSLGWAPVPGATSYTIFQDDVSIGTTNDNRFVAEGLKEGTTYKFAVFAMNSLGTSPESMPVSVIPGSDYTNVTYYTAWSNTIERKYTPFDVDASHITHINYAFADVCWKKYGTGARACEDPNIALQKDYVHDGEIVIGDPERDFDNMSSWVAIREQNPHLKLMVSVGGWNWSKNFSNVARTEVTRRTFANSAVDFLREYQLDGLDVDWEYPVEGGVDSNSRGPEDKENFVLLMKTVREALDAAGSEDGKYYLLTIASGQGDNFVVNADLANSSKYLDFINIMSYDYSGKESLLAHHNSPLYYDKKHPRTSAPRNNVLGGLNGHLKGGVPTYKLVAGVPYYGKGWGGCPTTGEYQNCKMILPGTWEPNLFDFQDIENNYLNKNGYKYYWNNAAKVAYVYNEENGNFITFNDKTTMMYTASLVKTLDIAGVMSWDISGDRNKTLTTQLVKDLPIHGEVNTSALPAPHNLQLASKSANALSLKWDAAPGATEYEIYVDKAMVGTTKETTYTITSLKPEQTYQLHLLAITKSGEEVQAVSVASEELSATTASAPTEPGSGNGGGSSSGGSSSGTPTTPAPAPTPPKGKDELGVQINKQADKSVVSVPEAAAIQLINASSSSNFQIALGDITNQAEIEIPQGVIAAIAKKDPKGTLSMMMNGAEHRIPVALISKGSMKVTIGAPSEKDAETANGLLKGMKGLSKPVLFKIEQVNADKSVTEMKQFGSLYVSQFITLDPKQIDQKRAAGMVFVPGTSELRSVPTLFKLLPDGKVRAELKMTAGGIYVLAENVVTFGDVIPAWAKQDVARAAAMLIAQGERANVFGGNLDITRAEMTSIIVRGLGVMPNSNETNFKDVDANSKYAKEIAAAKAAGLVQGKSGDRFDPNGLLTREELAVILANAMNYAGKSSDANSASLAKFKDQKDISAYAKSSLALLVEHKIIQGVSKDQIAPQMNVTKAQTVVTVMRMLRVLGLSD